MRKNINFKYIISIENPEAYKDPKLRFWKEDTFGGQSNSVYWFLFRSKFSFTKFRFTKFRLLLFMSVDLYPPLVFELVNNIFFSTAIWNQLTTPSEHAVSATWWTSFY